MKTYGNILHFKPASSAANTSHFNMAHRCVIPLTNASKVLRKKEQGRILLREGEAAELSRHLENPEFVRFLRDYLGVVVIPDDASRGDILQEFSLIKAA